LRHLIWEEGSGEEGLSAGLDRVARGELSPYALAREIVADLKKELSHGHA
jgi:hypothetical protein